jgi:hypothetical protein
MLALKNSTVITLTNKKFQYLFLGVIIPPPSTYWKHIHLKNCEFEFSNLLGKWGWIISVINVLKNNKLDSVDETRLDRVPTNSGHPHLALSLRLLSDIPEQLIQDPWRTESIWILLLVRYVGWKLPCWIVVR